MKNREEWLRFLEPGTIVCERNKQDHCIGLRLVVKITPYSIYVSSDLNSTPSPHNLGTEKDNVFTSDGISKFNNGYIHPA